MVYIEIKGVKYPVENYLGAYIEFKKLTGKEVDQVSGISEMAQLLYCFVKATCRAEKKEFTMDCEEFCDNVEPKQLEVLTGLLGVAEPEAGKGKKK